MLARRLESEDITQLVEKTVGHLFPDSHRAVALDIRMPAHRADAGAGSSDMPAEQHQVDDFLNGGDGLPLLRQPHGPARNHVFRTHHHICDFANLPPRDATLLDDVIPRNDSECRTKIFESGGFLLYETLVNDLARLLRVPLQNLFAQPLEKGQVAADANLHKMRCDLGSGSQQLQHLLRVLEARNPNFRKGIDADDRCPAPGRPLQTGKHAGVVGARILPNNKDSVSEVEV